MNKLTRISATVVSSVALVAGFGGVAGATPVSSISNTGHKSWNTISSHQVSVTKVHNDNDVTLTNNNPQAAFSGPVEVERNFKVGTVSSGAAGNDSSLDASVTVDDTAAAPAAMDTSGGAGVSSASISGTGARSFNTIFTSSVAVTEVNNDNDVHVTNNNWQTAASGPVEVEHNLVAGNVTSGAATNTSETTMSVSVSN